MSEALIVRVVTTIDRAETGVSAAYIRSADYIRAAEITVSDLLAEMTASGVTLRNGKLPARSAISQGFGTLDALAAVGITVSAALKPGNAAGTDVIYRAMKAGVKRVLPAIVTALETVTGDAERFDAAVAVASDVLADVNSKRRAASGESDASADGGEQSGEQSGAAAVEGEDRARRVRVAEQAIKSMTRDIRNGSIVPDPAQVTALGQAALALVEELAKLQSAKGKPVAVPVAA